MVILMIYYGVSTQGVDNWAPVSYTHLPDEVDGVKLSWSQEKSNMSAKIAMLEVVVIVLLVLEKKEKKKRCV